MTKLGFKRLKKSTPENLLKRIKEIEKAILSGKYRGQMLKVAKKAHADHTIRYRMSLGLKNNQQTQMIFPEFLKLMGVINLSEHAKKKSKIIKKSKNKKRKAS